MIYLKLPDNSGSAFAPDMAGATILIQQFGYEICTEDEFNALHVPKMELAYTQVRYRLIPQEVIEDEDWGDYSEGFDPYPTGKTIPHSRYEEFGGDFYSAEQWQVGPDETKWIVLSGNGMYRRPLEDEIEEGLG